MVRYCDCLSVEQRAGEILRYGDLRSRALHGRETMQELRRLVTANEVWQSACMPAQPLHAQETMQDPNHPSDPITKLSI